MNPTLQKIQTDIAAHVTPKNKEAFDRTVIAGKEVMYNPKTHANMQLVKNPNARKDIVNTVAQGVAGLMWVLYMQSKKSMPVEVLIMAGTIIMTEALDFAERSYGTTITNDVIAETKLTLDEIMYKKLGYTPEQVQQAINDGAQEINDYKSGKITDADIQSKIQEHQGVQ